MPLFGRKKYSSNKAKKKDMPNGLWLKCPACSEIIFKQELSEHLGLCNKCGHHFQLSREERLAMLVEEGSFEEWDTGLVSVDALKFQGTSSYPDKLRENREKTGQSDAVVCGRGRIGPHAAAVAVMDFAFLGASMGAVVGEKITRLFERATKEGLPVLVVCASGGARMYEGMFSLMQMAKTSGAIERHQRAGLAYIALLTHPTMAGVMASFATLGDVILAEPGALIGFAGPRVIKETTQRDLPEGFQRSEFLLDRGLLDAVVDRKALKETLVSLLHFMHVPQPQPEPEPEPES